MARKMKLPTDEQFEIALLWLENNEGVGREMDACRAVASWIERGRYHEMLRQTARQAGGSVAALRRKLAGKHGTAADEMEN